MNAFVAIGAAAALLLVGMGLRARLRLLARLYIPASVIGGLLGLALLQAGAAIPETAGLAARLGAAWRGWPGPLIAVIFAALLLEHRDARVLRSVRRIALAAGMVWVIALGQVALGLLAVAALGLQRGGVPGAIGQMIEAGFAGGHGTAAALGQVLAGPPFDFAAGLDLGLFMATVGLVWGVVSGIVLVNVGVRRGWLGVRTPHAPRRAATASDDADAPRGRESVLDPLALQVGLLALALLVGFALKLGFGLACGLLPAGRVSTALGNVPLFMFALLGGGIVRRSLVAMRSERLIDSGTIQRLAGAAMEFLIVAALASLRLDVVAAHLDALIPLALLGAAWSVFCLLWLSPRLLPRDNWFELGLVNYGMSTATTAQGLMLLRLVDERLESGAAEVYALAAPWSAPFVGGGMITLALPLLVDVSSPLVVGAAAAAAVAIVGVAMRLLREPA